jgi:hypothetical protein
MVIFLGLNYIWAQSNSSFGKQILAGDLPEINQRLVPDIDRRLKNGLFVLDKNELRLLRNTIYAKYGYKFNAIDLQNHFGQFDWYKGTKINVDAELAELDRENIRLIQQIEENYPQLPNENIVGYWIDFQHGGQEPNWNAIDNEIGYEIIEYSFLSFYSNGTFFVDVHYSKGYGLWKIENNKLVLTYLFRNNNFLNISDLDEILHFSEIQSPGRKKYLGCNLNPPGFWIKVSNIPGRYDK